VAGREREALVTAWLALGSVASTAIAEGAPRAAVEAKKAARTAEVALGLGDGCPGCGGEVPQRPGPGRPRRWCLRCSPRKTRGKSGPAATLAS
jgi:hypothetical protein